MENSGYMVKDARIKLGLKQEDIACDGIGRSLISYIESGKRALDEDSATKISNQMNLKIKENNINVGFEVTPELLLGRKENDIERLVNNLNDKTKYCYVEIDEYLEKCTCELGEKLINKMYEEVFKNSFSDFRDEIIKYFNISIKFMTDKKMMAEKKVIIIKAKLYADSPNKYKDIIEISNSIGSDIDLCDDMTLISYCHNVSISYYHEGDYNKALKIIKRTYRIKNNPFYLRALSIEANICIKQKRYERALNIYIEIIKKSKDTNEIANAYSNIADIYNTQFELEKAVYYINKAFEFIDKVNEHYRFNLYYVKLQIDINKSHNIQQILKLSLESSKKLNSKDKSEKVLELAIGFEKNNNNCSYIIEIIKELELEINSRIFLDLIPFLGNKDICKLISEISHY